MFNGLEIDMISIGDADCILVTQWSPFDGYLFRVLVDGGSKTDAKQIKEFLGEAQLIFMPWSARTRITTMPVA
jgi:hypothetical protein